MWCFTLAAIEPTTIEPIKLFATDLTFRWFTVLVVASLCVLFVSIGYFLCFRFYRRPFYGWCTLAWFINALYLAIEAPFVSYLHKPAFAYFIFLVGTLGTFPFLAASISLGAPRFPWKLFGILSVISLLLLAVTTLSVPYFAGKELLSTDVFPSVTIGGVVFSTLVLFFVFLRLPKEWYPHDVWRRRSLSPSDLSSSAPEQPLSPEPPEKERDPLAAPRRWVRWTFFGYAALQPLYLYRKTQNTDLLLVIFGVALLLKILNVCALLRAFASDLLAIREDVARDSALADLRAMTFAIQHESNTPIGALASLYEELKREYQHDLRVKTYAERLKREIVRLRGASRIVSIVRGNVEFYRKIMSRVSLEDVVRSAWKHARIDAPPGTNFDLQVSGRPQVEGLRTLLEEVFLNLFKNSIEAINERKGSTPGTISVRIWRPKDGTEAVITVEDDGAGIPVQIRPEIFKLFSTKTEKKGNPGLGLFISKKIVTTIHGGSLDIDWSEVGKGTRMILALPISKYRSKVQTPKA